MNYNSEKMKFFVTITYHCQVNAVNEADAKEQAIEKLEDEVKNYYFDEIFDIKTSIIKTFDFD